VQLKLFEDWLAIGGGFIRAVEIDYVLLFHLPSVVCSHAINDCWEVDNAVVSGPEDDAELLQLADVFLKVCRLVFEIFLDLGYLSVVNLESDFAFGATEHASKV